MFKLAAKKIKKFSQKFASYRECPLCGWSGHQFAKGGSDDKLRFDCRCPRCNSLERHRLAFMVAEHHATLDFSTVLHVAPERQLSSYIKSKSENYLSIDLYAEAMAQMDITALQLPNESQSLVWVSHVFEHVENDSAAISELHRVLQPSGIAFVQVPIWRTITYENPGIKDGEGRCKHFYQPDHVRLYGLDIVDRFNSVGFSTVVHRSQDFGPRLLLRHGLSFASTDEVFLFKKAGVFV